jgi:regulator of protease activity HflC (stomatin/prohibitin superfamily)
MSAAAPVILWSVPHHSGEVSYVVGDAPRSGDGTRGATDSAALSLMAADIPVYFRVNDLYSYAYLHQDAKAELRALATREVVRYLAEADFNRLLGPGRAAAAATLQERVQAAAGEVKLGITVVFVGLQGLHPPVETGGAFDGVVGASEQMHQTVLEAEAYAARRKPEAEGQHDKVVRQAEAYRSERGQVAQAEAERFGKQLLAYRASPRLFVLNSFLDVLETEGAAIRKYVVATSKGTEVFVIDLKEKLRPDLLDLNVEQTGQGE